MKITIYYIYYGSSPNCLLIFVNNSIPFVFVNGYIDVKESIIKEFFVNKEELTIIKKICKDTSKECILNCNHDNGTIRDIVSIIIGNEVTWKKNTFKFWDKFISSVGEIKNSVIEIDHPIDFKDGKLIKLIEKGNKISNKRDEEIRKQFNKIRYKIRKIRNGK